MPKGGKREGAGRPSGTGRYAESARSVRVPHSLLGPVSEMLAEHLRSVAAERRVSEKQVRTKSVSSIVVPPPGTASVIGPIDATAMLCVLADQRVKGAAVVLDPMYRGKQESGRAAYLSETVPLLESAARVAPNIFLWGFPESVARLVDHWPSNLKLEAWLTWFFKNVPSRSKSWRPSQQACLHLRRRDGKLYPEHFYSERHRALAKENKLEFKMTPYSVIEQPLLSGFIRKSEQTGFRMQKPESVIEPLLRMTTEPGDLVIDPTCGSGTTGSVAIKLGCAAILSDRSGYALRIARRRLSPPASKG